MQAHWKVSAPVAVRFDELDEGDTFRSPKGVSVFLKASEGRFVRLSDALIGTEFNDAPCIRVRPLTTPPVYVDREEGNEE